MERLHDGAVGSDDGVRPADEECRTAREDADRLTPDPHQDSRERGGEVAEPTGRQLQRDSQAPDTELAARAELTRKLSACDRKLNQYRAALDAGAGPVEVTGWINAVKQERAKLDGDLRATPRGERLSCQEITDMIERIGNLVEGVTKADPDDKADLYKEVGLRMTYRPQKQLVEARLMPDPHMCK
jgi:hypothetical protein